jgi:cyclic-di-GMP phosphodiesterase TipF (flagellum assembly factor)
MTEPAPGPDASGWQQLLLELRAPDGTLEAKAGGRKLVIAAGRRLPAQPSCAEALLSRFVPSTHRFAMTRQFAEPEPLHERFADAFVILSVTLLSLALGAWLIARLQFGLSSAMLASLGVYCTLLLLHLVVRRTLAPAREPDADPARGDAHWGAGEGAGRFEQELAHHLAGLERANHPPGEMPAPPSRPGTWPVPLPMPDRAEAADAPPAEAADPFQFRPSRTPYFEEEAAPEPAAEDREREAGEAAQTPVMAAEMDVERIQSLIKQLADELNGPPAQEGDVAAAPAPADATEAMIGRSVAALGSAARAMRGESAEPAAPAAAGRAPSWWLPARDAARTGAPPGFDPGIAPIAEALAAERIEVLLEPIHALAEGRPRHYEVSMRLRTADGAALEQSEISRTAAGSGLMPRIDAARMLRAARLARRLGERGQQGSVLTAAAGESLTADAFLDAAALQPGSDGRIGLVLAFTQSDVRSFTPVHTEALGTMAASGFGFALEDVTDLDMDFGALKAIGFEFVKLDAQVFLEGLEGPGGHVPAADICRRLAEFGLTLIVGRIEDDWLRARILGFGVLLGKGALFGGPKLVKAEVVAEPGSAAA